MVLCFGNPRKLTQMLNCKAYFECSVNWPLVVIWPLKFSRFNYLIRCSKYVILQKAILVLAHAYWWIEVPTYCQNFMATTLMKWNITSYVDVCFLYGSKDLLCSQSIYLKVRFSGVSGLQFRNLGVEEREIFIFFQKKTNATL